MVLNKDVYDVKWYVSPNGKTYYVCPVCGEEFSDLTAYYRHLKYGHHEVKNERNLNDIILAILVNKFGKDGSVKAYAAVSGIVARQSEGSDIVCPFCGESFLSKPDLAYHIVKRHSDELEDTLELNFGKAYSMLQDKYLRSVALEALRNYFSDDREAIHRKKLGKDGVMYYKFSRSGDWFPEDKAINLMISRHFCDMFTMSGREAELQSMANGIVNELARHSRKINTETHKPFYRCPVCGAWFDSERELLGHLEEYTPCELVFAYYRNKETY